MSEAEVPQYNLALVGASTLKGKEVKSLLEERGFPVGRLALLDAEEARGQLTEFDDEPVIIQPVGRDSFEQMAFAVFASAPSFTEEHWQAAEECGCQIIDLSYSLETHPRARLRAPLIECLLDDPRSPLPGNGEEGRLAVSAHPAAMAIAGVLGCLSRRFAVLRAVTMVLEPVSERDKAGVEELSRQTVNLLAFQQIPKDVFDSQVAFNVLSSYGGQSHPTLREAQTRIGRHVRELLGGRAIQPAVRLVQAPVFFGHAFCCYVDLAERVPTEAVEEALHQKPLQVSRDPEDQPNVVGVAGSNEISLGAVERDPAAESGYWIWGAMDNVRLAALNAVEIVEEKVFTAAGRAT
ncbi:MAG: Asd/ArgC dimerization domain-containing protein [Terriglobia bacterium]